MSQHRFLNRFGRFVIYGVDKPMGGFFFTEFVKDSELREGGEEVFVSRDGLKLSELIMEFQKRYSYVSIRPNTMIAEYKDDEYPSPLQIRVGKMFGRDIVEMLEEVEGEFIDYY